VRLTADDSPFPVDGSRLNVYVLLVTFYLCIYRFPHLLTYLFLSVYLFIALYLIIHLMGCAGERSAAGGEAIRRALRRLGPRPYQESQGQIPY
jgi:hypothetical protein